MIELVRFGPAPGESEARMLARIQELRALGVGSAVDHFHIAYLEAQIEALSEMSFLLAFMDDGGDAFELVKRLTSSLEARADAILGRLGLPLFDDPGAVDE